MSILRWFDRDDFMDFLDLPADTAWERIDISYSPARDQILVDIEIIEQ